jgi:hypothetical protein
MQKWAVIRLILVYRQWFRQVSGYTQRSERKKRDGTPLAWETAVKSDCLEVTARAHAPEGFKPDFGFPDGDLGARARYQNPGVRGAAVPRDV